MRSFAKIPIDKELKVTLEIISHCREIFCIKFSLEFFIIKGSNIDAFQQALLIKMFFFFFFLTQKKGGIMIKVLDGMYLVHGVAQLVSYLPPILFFHSANKLKIEQFCSISQFHRRRFRHIK